MKTTRYSSPNDRKSYTAKKKQMKVRGKQGKRVETYIPGTIGFPDTYVTKLKYAETIDIAPGAVIGQYSYRGNSLYDPDFSGGGHQPGYFDELSKVYTRYRVLGAKITVSFMNNVGTSPLQAVIIPCTEVFTVTTISLAMENPRVKLLPLLGVAGYQTTTGSLAISTSTILGLKGREVYDLDYSALVTSNPVSIWYFIVVASDISSTNVGANGTIHIEYLAEFYDKREITQSFEQAQQAIRDEEERRRNRPTVRVGPVTQVTIVDQPVKVAISSIK